MTNLFGMAMAPLLAVLAHVESANGKLSENVYQLRNCYVRDVNRIAGTGYVYGDVFDRGASEEMMCVYWAYYGARYTRLTGRQPDYEVLARTHAYGPDGWRSWRTDAYWHRVKRILDAVGITYRGEIKEN